MLAKLLKSRTIVVNLLTVALGVAGYLAGNEVIAQHPQAVSTLIAASGVMGVILRLLTSVPISAK